MQDNVANEDVKGRDLKLDEWAKEDLAVRKKYELKLMKKFDKYVAKPFLAFSLPPNTSPPPSLPPSLLSSTRAFMRAFAPCLAAGCAAPTLSLCACRDVSILETGSTQGRSAGSWWTACG